MEATEEQIEMYSYYSDVFKDVHNIRPRWLRPADHTVEEWQAMIDEVLKEIGPDPLRAWYDTSAELE